MQRIPSAFFASISLSSIYNQSIASLTSRDCSADVANHKDHMLTGRQVLWGIPFELGGAHEERNVMLLKEEPVVLQLPQPLCARYFIFLHAADHKPADIREDGLFDRPMRGEPRLGETVCEYRLEYEDGSTSSFPIRRRLQINEFRTRWGEGGFECVPHLQPTAIDISTDSVLAGQSPEQIWGFTQFRVTPPGTRYCPMKHWLYALENPQPDLAVVSMTFIPRDGNLFLFGLSAGAVQNHPLRWEPRKKFKLLLPDSYPDKLDTLQDCPLRIDLGEIISILPALRYEHARWTELYDSSPPSAMEREYWVEYTAHPEAVLHFPGLNPVPVREIESHPALVRIREAALPVTLKVIDRISRLPVPVKLHVHGEHGEYLTPIQHHRIPNKHWFEDYGTDHVYHNHRSTYINGIAEFKLPLGIVYVEVSKGFEIRPVRTSFEIVPATETLVIEIERALHWRSRGWVTADTHVHFLSPRTALLEGEAEGVNVVNLLASQWGELMTNIGDYDGKTTFGSKETGGAGEYLVRVATENRQHILGHISLIGYSGNMILPLATGGANEGALGDPVETTLTQWAMQCRAQNGIAVLPHFPHPRAEGAASLVLEQIDGVEMCAYSNMETGINPYSLSDWYRYLNCGYQVPAVAGTDKMSAEMAIGTIRTYSLIREEDFTFEAWMNSIRRGQTFVTYGPLLEFRVEGKSAGAKLALPVGGGTLHVNWEIASVTIPVTCIEVIANGEIREARRVDPAIGQYTGTFAFSVQASCWIALRVRARHYGGNEIIAAHSSSIMAIVGGEPCFQAADALTILDQIEGSAAYIRSIGTRAEQKVYQKMLMTLTSAHRALHNRMHQNGVHHRHTVADDHHHN